MALADKVLFPLLLALPSYLIWRILTKPTTNSKRLPLPPGPKPLPLIGNLLDMPMDKPWLKYHEMAKTYGDVIYMNILGVSIVVLNSFSAANEVMDKCSTTTSDRPKVVMINELIGLENWAFSNMPYDATWRKHRKQFRQDFSPGVIHKYHDVLIRESRTLLRRILDNPDQMFSNIRLAFAAMIMDITYGIKVDNMDNKYVDIAEKATDAMAQAAVPGKFLVDILPILKHLPSWFPGAGFQRTAEVWRGYNEAMRDLPFEAVKAAMKDGTAAPSIAASLIDALPEGEKRKEAEILARNTTAVAYSGGSDTTVSAVESFILAMVIYPEVQRKAHSELDTVVGSSRFPDFQDRDSLPYINAVVKETMRWQAVTPLGGAHAATEDTEYNGYCIPKGAYVIGNSWSILHDSVEYPEPLEFKPERFLKDGKLNPAVRDPNMAFGFGRRICPGRYFSDATLYAVVCSLLSAYNITPIVDDQGKPLLPKVDMVNAAISHPLPFKCRMEPRSEKAKALVHEHYATLGF